MMADPFSIINLLSTSVTLTTAVLKYALTVKQAPKELEELSCELTKLDGVLGRLVEHVERDERGEEFKEFPYLFNAAADLVITLKNAQAKLDKRSTATGFRKVCNNLTWPFDGSQIQKLLRDIQRDAHILQFALTIKSSESISQTAGRSSEILSASQGISQSQSSISRAIDALPKQTELIAELSKLRLHIHADQKQEGDGDQNLLRELSILDFTAKQKGSYGKRHANTGQWLLESSTFQAWLNSGGPQDSVLWCQGNPGVGKTVITSIAINHVTESTCGRKIALIYIYCDYANPKTYLVLNLLRSMIRQLVAQTSNARKITQLKAFLKTPAKNRDMTEEDSVSWIETLLEDFEVVYTFVDALDECPESGRNSLLARLKCYSEGIMRVFVTSRSNVNVRLHIPHAIVANVDPIRNDITDYVDSKIQKSSRLARLTASNKGLKQEIVHTINRQANGMFLLASLQIESLGDQISAAGVRLALKRLPADIFAMYDQTIERIGNQSKQNAELGFKALSMMFGAKRELMVGELQHALTVEPGKAHLDPEAVPDLDILLNATAGLVDVIYSSKEIPREIVFVHRTLEEYFNINRERLFPELSFIMARICLSYLSFEDFESGACATKDVFFQRRKDFCFFSYASGYWASHLRDVQTKLMDQSLAFIQNDMKTAAWLQCIEYDDTREIIFNGDIELPLNPAFLAAQLHLSELCAQMISLRGNNTRNTLGETPLHLAVYGRQWGVINTVAAREDELRRSRDADQYATVQVLLEQGAEIDAKDSQGRTAAFTAVNQHNGDILSLLLDCGANVNARNDDSVTLLHCALDWGDYQECLQILLDRSPDVNALTNTRQSVILKAVDYVTSTMIDRLIYLGADVNVADSRGMTPLLQAARRPRLDILKTFIKRGAYPNVTDSIGRTPLHFAPLWYPHFDVLEIVSRIQSIDAQDKKERTPLHHAYYTWAQSRDKQRQSKEYLRDFGDQTLHTPGYAMIIEELIKLGASETITDAEGRTPEEYSQWSTYRDTVRWFKSYDTIAHGLHRI